MLIQIIILFFAIPVGLLIARLTKDEMKDGRIYFQILEVISLAGLILFWVKNLPYIAYTFGFVIIVSVISSQSAKRAKNKV